MKVGYEPPSVDGGAVREAGRRAEARRQTPEARDRRERSRRAFIGLDRAEALAVARSEDPGLVETPPFRSPGGDVVRSYIDDHQARVTVGGRSSVVVSTTPLRTVNDRGEKVPVDLTMEARAGQIEPRDPLTRVSAPEHMSTGVRVGDLGVRIGAEDGSAARVVEGKVFYANTDVDTDTFVKALPSGIETYSLLRSERSPEALALRFDLAEGESLRQAPGSQELEIMRADHLVGTVSPPAAVDAQGATVPVGVEVIGDVVVLRVAHRNLDFAYPIVVDPQIASFQWLNGSPPRTDFTGWGTYESCHDTCGFRWTQGNNYETIEAPNPDNYFWSPPNVAKVFEVDYYGEWSRQRTSFVYGVDEGPSGWTRPTMGTACRYSGLYSTTYGWSQVSPTASNSPDWNKKCTANEPFPYPTRRYCWDRPGVPADSADCQTNVASSGGEPGPSYVVFGTSVEGANEQHTNYFWDTLYGANVYIGDPDAPSITNDPPPTGWVDHAYWSAGSTDFGIGLKSFALTSDDSTSSFSSLSSSQWSSSCTADPTNHCGPGASLGIDTKDLHEGSTTITATAKDLIGGPGHETIRNVGTAKVDRTSPAVVISGDLWDQRSSTNLDAPDYGVRVDASDGDAATHATERSGVKSIDIYVDTHRVDYVTQGCVNGSCPMSEDWLFESATYGPGPHTIKVDVLDQLDHLTRNTWTVTVAAKPFSCTGTPPYGVFWAGSSFEGLPMTGSARFCEAYDPIMGRNEMVSFDYGDCQPDTTSEGGCVAPLEVQSSPMCERHASLYTTGDPAASEPYPYDSATIRGVPAAKFDGGTAIELYTGNTTVSVYGDDPAQVLRLANAIVASPDYLTPATAPFVSPLINLGLPTSPDVLASTTECTS
jgi:hypothetical protein